jgi:hypothetical protein
MFSSKDQICEVNPVRFFLAIAAFRVLNLLHPVSRHLALASTAPASRLPFAI